MRLFKYFLIIFVCFSCSSKKDILLIQNINKIEKSNFNFENQTVKVDDILKIKVSTQNPELSLMFNPSISNTTNSLESTQIDGYLVNSEGFINFPLLGKIYVKGLTLTEISDFISSKIISEGFLLNPIVDVKNVSYYFTVLGEVNMPGKHSYIKNNMDVLQAIGMAGDLTINGKRDDVKILRNNDGEVTVSTIDLTSADFLSDPSFQIFSGDIILVNPNNSRVKNAGIIGNSGNLVSLLSFLLSSIILITNAN